MSQNNNTKIALILLGSATVVASLAALLYYNDDARQRMEGIVNRERAKYFVRHRLNGNDTLINAVDNLSDAEVNTIVKLAGKSKDIGNKSSDAFNTIIDRAKDMSTDVADKVQDYFS